MAFIAGAMLAITLPGAWLYGLSMFQSFRTALVVPTVVTGIAGVRRMRDMGWPISWFLFPFVALVTLVSAMEKGVQYAAIGWPLILGAVLVLCATPTQDRPPRGGGRSSAALTARIKRNARPTMQLSDGAPALFSKLGGAPEMDASEPWPAYRGEPLAFIAQIDLGEVRAAGGPEWLPANGWLYFFALRNEAGYGHHPGFEDTWRVIHLPWDETIPVARIPPERHLLHREKRLGMAPAISYPSTDWLGLDPAEADFDEEAFEDAPEGPQHRLGGYPDEIQGGQLGVICQQVSNGRAYDNEPTEYAEREGRKWQLLLQVDSDGDTGMNFGDGGMLYFFIRERDAQAGRFSKAWLLTQFY